MFSEEIQTLERKDQVSSQSKLVMLHPFLDDKKILRVGGRLRNANLPEKTKHPIILPKSHYITELIVRHYHHKYLHGGSELILSALRMQYWIISARTVVRKVLRKCVTCFRHKSVLSQQLIGDLPVSRVNPGRAFSKSGVDFGGPFQVKPRRGRGVRALKTYACIFVCFITKAVHLELVGDLTANSFIAVLKRFIARRGRPEELYTDYGTNFIGACRELRKWASNEVINYIANEGVTLKFNPPSSPHFGGLWEASVKSMKTHMKRAIGSQVLTYEEFSTYLAEIEACLNSRPLVPVSSDPEDCTAITSAHFLIGTSLKGIPEPDFCNKRISLCDRWKQLQQMTQSFWKRWSLDYLTQLQQRRKWQKQQHDLKVNDLVLIKEDNLPP
ncbi:integrase catalytic domain-containing protein [Trichonephila clavipes]|nr:integrase catalytic domain-containing protein [Trichonephila clavipes]